MPGWTISPWLERLLKAPSPAIFFYLALLLLLGGCNKVDGQHVVVYFAETPALLKEVEFIKQIPVNFSSQRINTYLRDQLWVETFLIKSNALKPTQIFIESKKPKYIWRDEFYLDHKLSQFLYDGLHPHLIHLDMPIEELNTWVEAENQVTLVLDQYELIIKKVHYNSAGGWYLLTQNLRINFGDDLSDESYKKLLYTLKYMFENNLTPSIIDLRYKAGAALNYGK